MKARPAGPGGASFRNTTPLIWGDMRELGDIVAGAFGHPIGRATASIYRWSAIS